MSKAVSKVKSMIRVWAMNRTGRGQLSRMNDHQLRDIGLTRVDASREIRKPFWK